MSAFFSLAVSALFFAAGFAPGMARLETRLPFWPAGSVVVLTVVTVAAAVCFALRALVLERLGGESFKSAVEGLELGSEIPGARA